RAQLHAYARGLGRADRLLPRVAHQSLHGAPDDRHLQGELEHLRTAGPAILVRHELPAAAAAAARNADVPRRQHAALPADPATQPIGTPNYQLSTPNSQRIQGSVGGWEFVFLGVGLLGIES